MLQLLWKQHLIFWCINFRAPSQEGTPRTTWLGMGREGWMRNKYTWVWFDKKKPKNTDQTNPHCLALQGLHYIFSAIHSQHQLCKNFDGLTISNTLQSALVALSSKTFITHLGKKCDSIPIFCLFYIFHPLLTCTTLSRVSISTKK